MDYFTATSPSSNGSPLLDASTTTLVGIAKTQGTVPCSLKAEVSTQPSWHITALTAVQRRRGQNRQAQRAYRDRKEKRRHELEDQIAVWKQKNEKLVQSCASQTEKVLQLNALIEDLNAQLEVTSQQSGFTEMWNDVDQFQQGFNLVPLHDKTPGSCSRGDDES